MDRHLSEYYCLPADWKGGFEYKKAGANPGFFKFGAEVTCYGRCEAGPTARAASGHLYDALGDVRLEGGVVRLPFDPSEVIDNLRKEHYTKFGHSDGNTVVGSALVRKAYYTVRKYLPVPIRRQFQKIYFSGWQNLLFPQWPVDFTVDTLHEQLLSLAMKAQGTARIPFIWFWPNGAPNCLVMTHDVETSEGRDFSPQLMDLDDAFGIKASFQVVPEERYDVPDAFALEIRARGFEFNIHDLNHDGTLYRDRAQFLCRAAKINEYAHKYCSAGFRAGSMYRNQDWFDAYEFSYDMSVPNVAHLEPQRGGCCTVMPYFIGKILEIPLTVSQDYSLFHILNDYSMELWIKQINLIRGKHGLMSFITHPDYLIEQRARKLYETLLGYLREYVDREKIWVALPGEVDRWWKNRQKMKLVQENGSWRIEGPDKERARIAYANLEDGRVVYSLDHEDKVTHDQRV
jgi:hypothetical protein